MSCIEVNAQFLPDIWALFAVQLEEPESREVEDVITHKMLPHSLPHLSRRDPSDSDSRKDEALAATIKKAAADTLKGYLKLDPAKFKITANGVEFAR